MHLLVLAEGYEKEVDDIRKLLEMRYYPMINPVDGKKTFYSPKVREAKLYDIIIQKEIKNHVLKDLGYKTRTDYHEPPKILKWLLKILKPMGWKPIKYEESDVIGGRLQRGGELEFMLRGHIIPLAEKEDNIDKDGYECV